MKGLIVKSTTWNGETCKIGMPGGRVGMAVKAMERDSYCSWSIGGYHKEEELHWVWKGGTLRVGDKIEIEFAEFDEDEATPPVLKYPHACPTPQKRRLAGGMAIQTEDLSKTQENPGGRGID